MPVRNVVRVPVAESFFHVYNRGHNKGLLFGDDEDYRLFIFLLQRCFGPHQLKSAQGRAYPWFGDRVQIQAYCLMPNHFHLLLYQNGDARAISNAMQSLSTTYSMYFNKRYDRRGPIFESVFKSVPIFNDAYLQHITRYIHLNPPDHERWEYSSYQAYIGSAGQHWLSDNKILNLFNSRAEYKAFVADYEALKDDLENIKHMLADQ